MFTPLMVWSLTSKCSSSSGLVLFSSSSFLPLGNMCCFGKARIGICLYHILREYRPFVKIGLMLNEARLFVIIIKKLCLDFACHGDYN